MDNHLNEEKNENVFEPKQDRSVREGGEMYSASQNNQQSGKIMPSASSDLPPSVMNRQSRPTGANVQNINRQLSKDQASKSQNPSAEVSDLGAVRSKLGDVRKTPSESVQRKGAAASLDKAKVDDATKISDVTKKVDPSDKAVSKNGKKDVKKEKRDAGYSETSNTVVSLIKCIAYITVVLVISVVISLCVIFAANDIYGFVKSDDQIEITIPENATIDDVADILHDNRVINYKWLFKMTEGDFDGEFCAGTYIVSPLSSYDELIDQIREKAPTGISWITIPEGYTTDEIIDLFVEKGIGEREAYIDVINNYDFDYWFVEALGDDWQSSGRFYRLDGYLFPDTYQFYNASTEEMVINKLLKRFNQVFIKSYKERAEELGYTVDDILIIASLIEKEAGTATDFGNVSSVFHNRLKNPQYYPYLDSDATIAYAIQHETGTRPNLTGDDIESYESPYNSYKNAGLVPGPIANPSNSAILAALNPSVTNYYFFVSDGDKTYFSETLEQHNSYVRWIVETNQENSSD